MKARGGGRRAAAPAGVRSVWWWFPGCLEPETDAQPVDELAVAERVGRVAALVEEELVLDGELDERVGVHVVLDAALGAGLEGVVHRVAVDEPDVAADVRLPLAVVPQPEVVV